MIAPKKNITLADIAERAEVAVKTASKVFKGDPSVRSYIRDRVLEEAKKVNYTPNTLAQAMRTKKLNLVSFHIAEFENPFYGQLFAKVAFKLGEKGIMVVPCDGVDKVNEANQNAFACATILADAQPDKVEQVIQNGPVITINCFDPETSLCSGIYMDMEWGYQNITQKVIDSGRSKVIKQCPNKRVFNTNQRKYRHVDEILKKNGLSLVETDKPFFTEADEIVDLAEQKLIDTVFCTNDLEAAKVIMEARKQGIKVPEDLLVVGCDGTFPEKSLWTIAFDFDLFAEMTVELLLKVLHGDRSLQQIKFKPELITPAF